MCNTWYYKNRHDTQDSQRKGVNQMHEVDTKELKKRMIDCNINTIEEFSRETGINRNTLSDVVNGKSRPSSYVMSEIVNVLKLTPEDAGKIFFANKLA